MTFVHEVQKGMGELGNLSSQKTACLTHLQRGFPWPETPSHFRSGRFHFLAGSQDSRRPRVRGFLGRTASRILFFRLNIPPYVPETARPHSHFPTNPDRSREPCLGLIGRNQYDRRSTPKEKPPHISEPRSWTTPHASATSSSPTRPSTDAMRRCGPTSSKAVPSRRSPPNSDTLTTPCAR
jgi:hypothetical protein